MDEPALLQLKILLMQFRRQARMPVSAKHVIDAALSIVDVAHQEIMDATEEFARDHTTARKGKPRGKVR